MGSNDCGPVKISGNDAEECSATTVEIKIKTLDSETFTLRVDKCVPVPELKEQIASVTGVLSDRQRLICRGRVLKDDQLLSAYHVEDGHTLHLVVRQPVTPLPETSSGQPASDPASSAEPYPGNRVSPSMVVGTFNISEQGDGSFPDLNRIISAVINSFGGMGRPGSGGEGIDLNQTPAERLSTAPTLGGLRNLMSDQSASAAVAVESAQPPIVPDSLTTLLQYLSLLRQEFAVNDRRQYVDSQNPSDGQDVEAAAVPSTESRSLLTPEFLADVIMCIRQLLNVQAFNTLSQLAVELSRQASVTCPLERSRIQSYALRSGNIFQNLGSLMLELGRAIMTLRMGQSPAHALVNAGPAVYVTSTGPNPIMVQPLPYQAGASSGSVPVGTVQHGGGSGGSSYVPRNIDIRIRAGSLFARREPPTGSQVQEQVAPLASNFVNSVQQDDSGLDSSSDTREPQVQAIPLRTVAGRSSSSDSSSRGSIGVLYPLLARVQHITLASSRASQTSEHHNPDGNNEQPMPDFATPPQNPADLGGNGNGSLPSEDQGFQSGIEEVLRRIFPGGTIVRGHADPPPSQPQTEAVNRGVGNYQERAQDVGNSQAEASDDGILLSNILRHIMPMISENTGNDANVPSTEGANSVENQADENPNQGNSSRRRHGSQSQENSKRQRRN